MTGHIGETGCPPSKNRKGGPTRFKAMDGRLRKPAEEVAQTFALVGAYIKDRVRLTWKAAVVMLKADTLRRPPSQLKTSNPIQPRGSPRA